MWRTLSAAAMLLFSPGGSPVGAGSAVESPAAREAADRVVTNGTDTLAPGRAQPPPAEALYAIPTRIDRIGRIIVPVAVNCRGPFQFVLDTGASATVLSPHLVEALGLVADPTQTVLMKGVTGSALVPTAPIDRLETGDIVLEGQRLAVADAAFATMDGVLGADGFANKVVLVDFVRDRVSVLDARAHRPSPQLARIPATLQFGRLLMVDALVGTHKIKAVVDTGAQRTLGNLALYAKLGLRPTQSYRDTTTEVFGATDSRQTGERHLVRQVTMDPLRITNLTVTFGDFYIFKIWNLQSQPALLIGMDMIGTLDIFGVDYLRREVQIKVAGPGSTASRAALQRQRREAPNPLPLACQPATTQ
ncbi:MAG: retroviral-like aspartic protease family protein [Steroidobacteraceae bacterium]